MIHNKFVLFAQRVLKIAGLKYIHEYCEINTTFFNKMKFKDMSYILLIKPHCKWTTKSLEKNCLYP